VTFMPSALAPFASTSSCSLLTGDVIVSLAEKVADYAVCNGATLYYESQGTGPTILFIAGSTGDAGNFSRTAELLADEFKAVTYDRRGNSRSPRPGGWRTTSVSEQADDAAALIRTLDLAPVAVFGASAAGPIALDLMIRYPDLVRAGILQEPSIFSVLPDPMTALAPRRAVIEAALPTHGAPGAVAALMRYLNDDAVLAAIPPRTLERMLGNAETLLSIEAPGFAGWQIKTEQLEKLEAPITLIVADDTLPGYKQVTDWLARQLGVTPLSVPGRHGFYYYRPQDLANILRKVLAPACQPEVG
jgi:pimeloyl-ACP methyl ester carboxylesterase